MNRTMILGVAMLAAGLLAAAPALAVDPLPSMPAACGDECRALRAKLTEQDAAELAELPAQVARGLSLSERAMLPLNEVAETVARLVTVGPLDGDFDKVRSGRRVCRVYWYGFLDTGSERVGSHQCRIGRSGGMLTIDKLSGDQLTATLFPYEGAVRAMVGRTFLPEHAERAYNPDHPANTDNENYGNKVGLAFAHRGRLYIVSINERGFTEPDRAFFEILAVQ